MTQTVALSYRQLKQAMQLAQHISDLELAKDSCAAIDPQADTGCGVRVSVPRDVVLSSIAQQLDATHKSLAAMGITLTTGT